MVRSCRAAGREDLTEAFQADVAFSPVSASYGRISASRTKATPLTITVRNLTGSTRTFDVAEQRFDFAAGTLGAVYGGGTMAGEDSRISSPDTLSVPANGTATLTLSVKAGLPQGTGPGLDHADRGRRQYQLAYWAQVAAPCRSSHLAASGPRPRAGVPACPG